MAITINSNYINSTPGSAPRTGGQGNAQPQAAAPLSPRRAELNYIPGPESLDTLIRSAQASAQQGRIPDRGSILNIVA